MTEEIFRFNVYVVDFDVDRRKMLIQRLLSRRRDRGVLWAREFLREVTSEGRKLIHQTNSQDDAEFVLQDLTAGGAKIEIVDLFPEDDDF